MRAVDPWQALDDPTTTPARVDAAAQQVLGSFPADDRRRVAGLTSWLVRRAGWDGSTALPATVLTRALRGYGVGDPAPGIELAAEDRRVTALAAEGVLAVPEVARAEETVAAQVCRILGSEPSGGAAGISSISELLAHPFCIVLAGRCSHRRTLQLELGEVAAEHDWRLATTRGGNVAQLDLLAGTDVVVVVVEAAHQLALTDAAQLLSAVAAGQRLVLIGDPDELEPVTPGRCFRDLAASGLVPVMLRPRVAADHSPRHLGDLLEAVRAGALPPVPPDQREVVVVPAGDAAQARTRAVQLATSSLPQTLSVPPPQTLVLTVRTDGVLGADALRRALSTADAEVEVSTVVDAAGQRARAVVLVAPAEAAGSLTRALLVSALSIAGEHISIVHQAGAALSEAVQHLPHRPRLTRLPALLRASRGQHLR